MIPSEGLLNTFRRASVFDIFVISFFVLPVAAGQWVEVLRALNWNVVCGLAVMVVTYVVVVTLMMVGASQARRRKRSKEMILGYLISKKFEMVSFERIRDRIDRGLSDDDLEKIIKENPTVFRRSRLKGYKLGLARLGGDDTQEIEEQP